MPDSLGRKRQQPAPESYFHIGIVVTDLEAAMARFSDALGITFAQPATFHIPILEDPLPHEWDLVAAFSMTQPPYYELIQAAGDGITSRTHAGKILYFAVWEPDMAKRMEELDRLKIGIDAKFRMEAKKPPFALITKPDLVGTRIEYVDISDKTAIEEWVKTGKFPGGIGAQRQAIPRKP